MKQHYVRGKEDVRWVCSYKIKNGADSCSSHGIRESDLKKVVASLINESSCNIDEVIKEYLNILRNVINNKPDTGIEKEKLQNQIDAIKKKKEKITAHPPSKI